MLLHHWDTDGISSAAIYLKTHGEMPLFTPKIGNFYLDDEDFNYLKESDEVVVLDMNLPHVDRLCKYTSLYIYDHHRATKVHCAKEHYNPSIAGNFYPSCTTVLMERFNYPVDYLIALGIVGDKGDKSKKIKEWSIVKKAMEKDHLKYDELKRAVDLLDSSFKLMKRAEVVENVHLLLQGIDVVLENSTLQSNIDEIEKEVEYWVGKAEDMGKYLFVHMHTNNQLISMVTRRLAWGNEKPAIVVNTKDDRDEFYIRSPYDDFNALPLIELAKNMGYNAGGKKEVMGTVLPRGDGEKLVTKILEVLKW